ncbi:MAG TPA: Zn-dependent hydrolase [Syntrophomonas sp.]|jgi:glyoxylase-like metal-dependent hydrolase (beta-lactamase superfamily II)|nr:Zn-dependent hydrolase [Syntrophomonas sp.]
MLNSSKYRDITIGRGVCSLLGTTIVVYLYVVDGLLIDAGPKRLKRESSKFFQEHQIDQVALTHVHEDHSGMAAWLQSKMQVPIYLHEMSIPEASKRGRYLFYRQLMWGGRPTFISQPFPEVLTTGKHIFDVIDSPGHMKYHKVFHEKNQGWLFTGDLYVRPKPFVAFYDENMKDTIASLQKLLQLDFDTVFCAHSGVVENGKAMLQEKLNYLLNLQEKVEGLRRQGLTDREVDQKLFPKIPLITKVSRGEWSSYNIISTIL